MAMAERTPVARLIGRGGDHPSAAVSTNEHRTTDQLGVTQHLHRRKKAVHVDMQHPAPPRCRPAAASRAGDHRCSERVTRSSDRRVPSIR